MKALEAMKDMYKRLIVEGKIDDYLACRATVER